MTSAYLALARSTAHWRPRRAAWLAAVEVVLMVACAIQIARTAWIITRPTAPTENSTAQVQARGQNQLSVLARFDPFFRATTLEGEGGSLPAGSVALELFGVRVAPQGGAAIIAKDGAQASYALGDVIAPGLTLDQVASDYVVLLRGISRYRLAFPGARTTTSAPVDRRNAVLPASTAPPPRHIIKPSDLLTEAVLMPWVKDGRLSGFMIMSRSDKDVLTRAGLQNGDVIISIAGKPLTRQQVAKLPELLAGAGQAEIVFERKGMRATTRIGQGSPSSD